MNTLGHAAAKLARELFIQQNKRHADLVWEKLQVRGPDARLLEQVYATNEIPAGELANYLGCDASNVTHMVNRMSIGGLVVRAPCKVDQRKINVVLTKQGEQLAEKIVAIRYETQKPWDELSVDSQQAIYDALQEIKMKLDSNKL